MHAQAQWLDTPTIFMWTTTTNLPPDTCPEPPELNKPKTGSRVANMTGTHHWQQLLECRKYYLDWRAFGQVDVPTSPSLHATHPHHLIQFVTRSMTSTVSKQNTTLFQNKQAILPGQHLQADPEKQASMWRPATCGAWLNVFSLGRIVAWLDLEFKGNSYTNLNKLIAPPP